MKHALRKYISSCGSALFMVISTMAALILLVTAMYLSVVSQRSVQLTIFNQNQAYVSATSISDMVTAYIMGKDCDAQLLEKFYTGPKGLEVYQSFSTDGNNFASFTGNESDAADPALGAYDITITRLADDKVGGENIRVYDIAVTVNNNGMLETTHSQFSIPESKPTEMPVIDQFFTSTGYLPNDVMVDSWVGTNSDLVADAEYTDITKTVLSNGTGTVVAGTTADVIFSTGIISAGSMHVEVGQFKNKEPMDWIIGNRMIFEPTMYWVTLGTSDTKRGALCVGEELITRGGTGFGYTDIYIQKDAQIDSGQIDGTVFIGNDATIKNGNFKYDVYILGDCTLINKEYYNLNFKNLYVLGDLNVYGNAYIDGNLYVGGNLTVNQDKAVKPSNMSVTGDVYLTSEYGNLIADNIGININNNKHIYLQKGTYQRIYNSYASDVSGRIIYSPTLLGDDLESYTDALNKAKTAFSMAEKTLEDKAAYMNEQIGGSIYPKWVVDSATIETKRSIFFPENNYIQFITEDCTIESIKQEAPENGRYTIIIDTGENESDVRRIRLKGNTGTINANGEYDTFQWLPGGNKGGSMINVLTVGNGSLVVDIPEGVTYQASDSELVSHLDWAILYGMDLKEDKCMLEGFHTEGWSDLFVDNNDYVSGNKFTGFVHTGCQSCTYTKQTIAGQEVYTCDEHGGTFTQAQYDKYIMKDDSSLTAAEKADIECMCRGKVVNSVIAKYIEDNSAVKARFEKIEPIIKEKIGWYEYEKDLPNVNIFLVSCAESADIQLGIMKSATIDAGGGQSNYLMNNKFFGYVYAPYMTFVSVGAGGGDAKICGGLVVSDYAISGSYNYLFVQSTRSIQNIVQPTEDLSPGGNRDWRIYGA